MLKYILQRLMGLVVVLLGISFLVFAIGKVTPGDPVKMMLGDRANPEDIARLRLQLHLDDPLLVQYGKYIWGLFRGDLGESYRGQTPVLEEILLRVPASLELGTAAFLFAVFLGLPAGLIAARHHNGVLDGLIMLLAQVAISVPEFWLAIVIIIVFGVDLKWIPITGGEGFRSLIAPAFCLGLGPAAILARLTRSSVLEVLQEDYVRTARAKGLKNLLISYRHIMRNAMIPVITFLGLLFAGLISGAVFIESVFARSGLGRFAIQAINARDMPQVQGIVLFGAALYVIMNLLVDILYSVIDPRIRYS
jgi:peptide/nickel transport system permease protein